MIRRMSGAQRFEFKADCAREDWHSVSVFHGGVQVACTSWCPNSCANEGPRGQA